MTSFIKISIALAALLLACYIAEAQPDSLYILPEKEKKLDTLKWKLKEEVGLYLNQVSFTNWNAGGSNSISAIVSGKASAKYKADNIFWNTALLTRYGINKQEGQGLRKTEDVLSIISNFGYDTNEKSNWFYSARFSFNTQYAHGFNYPDRDTPISKFMAPGYLFLGTGLEYGRHIEKFSIYASPFTLKTTFVLDDDLANAGAFGVDPAIYDMDGNILRPGKKIRRELGILLTNEYENTILENVKMNSLLRLYTDYINSFGNVDVEWEVTFDFKVNKYVNAILGSHIRYDNDIKSEVEKNEMTNERIIIEGPKIQWKQLLGIGVVVDLTSLTKEVN
ncbi:DUF3078 domain-containing protein [Winogradskyella sp. A3E31]|uniref:DUF3078 domain-containing protein n=1 Tax=Winogradskyella sp. A3E31 TaxID=3349637 RepID=UPI00398B424C